MLRKRLVTPEPVDASDRQPSRPAINIFGPQRYTRRNLRLAAAIAIGLVCGLVSFFEAAPPTQDFYVWWLAARTIVAGGDPYKVAADWSGIGFLYPLPTALVTL